MVKNIILFILTTESQRLKNYRKDAEYAKGAMKKKRISYFINNYFLFALLCALCAFAVKNYIILSLYRCTSVVITWRNP